MATEEETIPFVGWKHDNRWPRIHRPMDSISSGAKIPARRSGTWSKKKKKNRDKSVCIRETGSHRKWPVWINQLRRLSWPVVYRDSSLRPPSSSAFLLSKFCFYYFSPPVRSLYLFVPSPFSRSLSHTRSLLFYFYSTREKIDFVSTDFEKNGIELWYNAGKECKKKKRKNKRKKKERERVAYLQITKLYRTFYRAVFFKYWPDSSDAPMVLDARISYYFSIVVPSDCLLIPRPYLSGKIAHPRLVQKHNETGRNRAEPFRLFISPPRSPTVISSGAVSSIQFILQRESTRRVYTPHFV